MKLLICNAQSVKHSCYIPTQIKSVVLENIKFSPTKREVRAILVNVSLSLCQCIQSTAFLAYEND